MIHTSTERPAPRCVAPTVPTSAFFSPTLNRLDKPSGHGALSRAAFAKTFRACSDRLRAYALSLTREPAAADDLVQEAALRMFVKRHQYTPGTHFVAWGRRVLYTCFLSARRREARDRERRPVSEVRSAWAYTGEADNGGPAALLGRELDEAVAALSPLLRESFELRLTGLSHEEIGERLDVPVGTVKSRVHHARRKLRAALGSRERTGL